MRESTQHTTPATMKEIEKVLKEVSQQSLKTWSQLISSHLEKNVYSDYTYGSVLRTLIRNKPKGFTLIPTQTFGKEGFIFNVPLEGLVFQWITAHDDSYLYLETCSVQVENQWIPLFKMTPPSDREDSFHPTSLRRGIEIWKQPFVLDMLPEKVLWRIVAQLDTFFEEEIKLNL